MAEVTKVKASDGTIFDINDADDYTKEEVDAMLALKADVGLSYTKSEEEALLAEKANTSAVETALANKADITSVYTKSETNTLLDDKADVGVSYTKAEEDALLADKADVGDSYTKAEDDALLADKANVGDSYTKAEDDALLADKADSTDVYTKAEVDALIGGIKMLPLLDWANPVFTFSSTDNSFTAQGDCYLFGSVYGSANLPEVSINGVTVIHGGAHTSTVGLNTVIPLTRLTTGDIVTLSNISQYSFIHIFNERSV